ncbi:filamin-A-like [Oppia nitens]|uniref:filamin-A-like n=1 Tax=Oppia nitens TaxID=1686743 RepID=UPI0023DB33C7|nr:filamin-A-like [Oppia nitens]
MSLKAHGGGLITGIAGIPNKFTVFTSGKSVTGLTVAFEGPSKPEINFHNNKDGSVDVAYTPKTGGDYKIHVKYENKEIIGSPFSCRITGDHKTHKQYVDKIKVSGPNLATGSVNKTNEVHVDCKDAGITGGINFAMEGPSQPKVNFINNKDLSITVQFETAVAGDYRLHLKFQDLDLPGSPYSITIN